jgi:lipoprotein-releasing system ATP-binding protein|tara:strand:+ start:776 stop:1468 length:693 start_codon:yes stop_codon:yes gene_type:complete
MSDPSPRIVLETRDVTRILEETMPVTLVRDINFSAVAGEFVSITGPSGSGKSSLLYLLGLLDAPTEGRVIVEGQDTSELNADQLAQFRLAHLGFVFQFHFLLPEFTILDNVTIPMKRLGELSDRDVKARGRQLLDDLEIGDQAEKHPDQLSGGQRQRVAIARALGNAPTLILADEPTGNLDTKNSDIVRDIFVRLAKEQGTTVIAVTHDIDFAEAADRNVHLVDGAIVRP